MPAPVIATPAAAPKFMLVGDVYSLLLSGEQTDNAFALIHSAVSPGFGPPPHLHTREDETFYMLDGEVTYYLNGTPHLLTAGSVLYIPKNVPHYFKNTGTSPAHFLIQVSPGGNFDRYLQEVGDPLPLDFVHTNPEPPTPAHLEKVMSAAPRYGIQFV